MVMQEVQAEVPVASLDSMGSPTSRRAQASGNTVPVFLSVMLDEESGCQRAILRCMPLSLTFARHIRDDG
jgi:hypothetical protein